MAIHRPLNGSPPSRSRGDHAHQPKRRYAILALLFVVLFLTLTNISMSLRTVAGDGGRGGGGGGEGRRGIIANLIPEGMRLKSYSSDTLSDLLDQWFYSGGGSEQEDKGSEASHHSHRASSLSSLAVEGVDGDGDGTVLTGEDAGEGSMQSRHAIRLGNDSLSDQSKAQSVAAVIGGDEEAEEEQLEKRRHRKWQFAEDVAAEASIHSDAMVAQGVALSRHVAGMLSPDGDGDGDGAFRECKYLTAGSRLTVHEYSHRHRRSGEHTTAEYYAVVRSAVLKREGVAKAAAAPAAPDTDIDNAAEVGPRGEAVWSFAHPIATVLNHFPISVTDDPLLNISKPFGDWKSVFFPVDDFMAHHQDAAIPKYLRPPQVIEPAPPLYAAVVRNAFITQGYIVTCDGHAFTSGGCLWEFGMKAGPHHEDKARMLTVGIPLCDKWCNGYYHFSHEHLPRLALVHALLLDSRIDAKLVMSHAPNGFQRGFLFDVLGIPRDRVISSVNAIAAVGVYPMPQRCGNTFTHLLHMMRSIVHTRLSLSPANNVTFDRATGRRVPLLLFAERGKLSRMPTNYYALKEQLMAEFKGRLLFESTKGDTGPRDQIGKFYRADIVLGPHGANLANMMWMRRGMHVIEISAVGDGNMCYYTTAGRVGLVHHLLLRNGGKSSKFDLSYDLFRKHVATALAAVEQSIAEEMVLHDVQTRTGSAS